MASHDVLEGALSTVPQIYGFLRALEAERNARRATIEWHFTSPQARIKLKKLYPVLGER